MGVFMGGMVGVGGWGPGVAMRGFHPLDGEKSTPIPGGNRTVFHGGGCGGKDGENVGFFRVIKRQGGGRDGGGESRTVDCSRMQSIAIDVLTISPATM